MKYYINAAILRQHGACTLQVELFVYAFGTDDVQVTFENFQKAQTVGLKVKWPVSKLFWGTRPRSAAEAIGFSLSEAYDCAKTDHARYCILLKACAAFRKAKAAGQLLAL